MVYIEMHIYCRNLHYVTKVHSIARALHVCITGPTSLRDVRADAAGGLDTSTLKVE